jgi:hypothetical protein
MTDIESALLTAIATSRPDPKDMVGKKGKVPSTYKAFPIEGITRRGFGGVVNALMRKGLVACYPAQGKEPIGIALTAKGLEAYRALPPAPAASEPAAPASEPAPALEVATPAPASEPAPAPMPVPDEAAWAAQIASYIATSMPVAPPPKPTPAPGTAGLSPAHKAWVTRRAMAAAKAAAEAAQIASAAVSPK